MKNQLAEERHLEEICSLMKSCAVDMTARGIQQWDESYPNIELVLKDIQNQNLYIFTDAEAVVGCIVMDEQQSPQYAQVKWQLNEEPILIIHRMAVSPEMQGKGMGKKLVSFAEEFGRMNGYRAIRLDAFKGNKNLQNFYVRLGYEAVGEIPLEYTAGPFVCFEKAI